MRRLHSVPQAVYSFFPPLIHLFFLLFYVHQHSTHFLIIVWPFPVSSEEEWRYSMWFQKGCFFHLISLNSGTLMVLWELWYVCGFWFIAERWLLKAKNSILTNGWRMVVFFFQWYKTIFWEYNANIKKSQCACKTLTRLLQLMSKGMFGNINIFPNDIVKQKNKNGEKSSMPKTFSQYCIC